MAMQMFLSIFSGLVATLVLMCTYAYYLIGALVPILVIFFFMQRLYMRNSRELKRLDGLTKSPVVSHFGESITGLSTIRAYQKQSQFMQDCFRLIDRNNQAIYLQLMLQRWLGLRLETLGSLFSFCTAVVVVCAPNIMNAVCFVGAMNRFIVCLVVHCWFDFKLFPECDGQFELCRSPSCRSRNTSQWY